MINSATLNSALQNNDRPIDVFRDTLKQSTDAIKSKFDEGAAIATLVHERAALIDTLLQHIWQHHIPADDNNIALVAVGGYGRGELHPGSDIDIMVLLREQTQDQYQDTLEKLVTFLWDIGLEIGHSVRSLQDCVETAREDITIATTLMEARLLAGPNDLFDTLKQITGPPQLWSSRDFFEAKQEEQRQRHHKFHDTAYNLEPNIKEGPGGLRDIQMIGWVAKRHFNADTLHELIGHGFLTEQEYEHLIEGQNFLWQVRFALHTLTKRREDRLLFDYQRTLAEQFGHQNTEAELGVEQFMKRYYRTIMELSRLNEMLLQHFQESIIYANELGEPTPLNKRFQIRKTFIEVTHDNVFQRYPFALLEVFLLMQQNPQIKGLRSSTVRLIRSHLDLIDDDFRQDIRNRSLFMEIVRYANGFTHALRRMNQHGILARYIPEFGHITGLMQYDLFHAYTVDEHTLRVVRNMRRLHIDVYKDELPLCHQISHTIAKLEVLYLAGLFHDIAKGRGGDHSTLGATVATKFCLQHDMSKSDAKLVAWLVENHLIMSMTAQRKDISDPDVILKFATRMGNSTRLDYLYLLTVSDMRATNPSLWNNWKSTLLSELYNATKRVLRRGFKNPIKQAEYISETQDEAHRLLQKNNINPTAIESLWNKLSNDYFLRHSADEIAWHTRGITERPDQHPLILLQQETKRGGTEIFIHTPLVSGIFATVTHALDKMSLTVVDARIIKASHGYTFDTYVVLEKNGEPIQDKHRTQEIINCLHQSLSQSTNINCNRRPARQLKHFTTKTKIYFNEDGRNRHTMMEVFAADRPGLLSFIGQALVEFNLYLHKAKISTIGERAEDVFFITSQNKEPITDTALLDRLRQRIMQLLDI